MIQTVFTFIEFEVAGLHRQKVKDTLDNPVDLSPGCPAFLGISTNMRFRALLLHPHIHFNNRLQWLSNIPADTGQEPVFVNAGLLRFYGHSSKFLIGFLQFSGHSLQECRHSCRQAHRSTYLLCCRLIIDRQGRLAMPFTEAHSHQSTV